MGHAYLNGYVPAFPKPKDQTCREVSPVVVHRDGREVCTTSLTDPLGEEGRKEYRRRLRVMWERQDGICCLYGFLPECPGPLAFKESTFEHEDGRGGGKRDDRIELPDGTWINGAAHGLCNSLKGSRCIPYNAARNKIREGSVDEVR